MGMKLSKEITEAAFQRQVLALAKLRGWRTAHFRPAKTTKGWRTAVSGDGKGFPDLVLIRGPVLIVAELKRSDKEKATREQAEWIVAFANAGVKVYLWTPENWDFIERVLA